MVERVLHHPANASTKETRMASTRTIRLEDVEIGDTITPQVRCISLDEVTVFWEAIHGPGSPMMERPSRFNSVEQAKKEGLPGPVIPGPMIIAIIAKAMTDWAPGVQLKLLDVILRQVVHQGADFKVYGIVTDKNEGEQQVEVDIYLEPTEGQPYVRGRAVLGFPSKAVL
ncbi:MAG: hypothetical protein EXR55_02155 [Dehalococcoidia bacterium]|nr:hypothetical protein [Dehalococcoidia bacterium]